MKKSQKIWFLILGIIVVLIVALYIGISHTFWMAKNSENYLQNRENLENRLEEENTFEEKSIQEENDFYEISISYPLDSRDKNKIIEDYVFYQVNQKREEWKIGGETYNFEEQLSKDFPDRAKIKYAFYIDYETKEWLEEGIVSYILTNYQYTGGAHGNSSITTFTFDKEGLLKIEDLIDLASDDNAIKLSRILLEELKNEYPDLPEDQMLYGLGLAYLKEDGKTFDKEKAKLDGYNFASNFQEFYLGESGITFLFSQYRVAPGAMGTVEATLSWEVLKPFTNIER